MQEYNWSKFTLRVPINTEVSYIYDSWTTQNGLEKWFLRKAEFTKPDKSIRERNSHIQKDDTYAWKWHGYGDESVERGTVLAANGKDFLKFVFGKAGIVSIKITIEEGFSIVELIQSEMPLDEKSKVSFHLGCTKGWVFYLANLKSILEGGLDLRNKNTKLKSVITA
jgi:uncharacterized protein YndB with AHSA1/START domain